MPKDEEKKKKPTLGERLKTAILAGTGADKVVGGFNGEDAEMAVAKRDPANQTNGIFDEGKFERNQKKKKK